MDLNPSTSDIIEGGDITDDDMEFSEAQDAVDPSFCSLIILIFNEFTTNQFNQSK